MTQMLILSERLGLMWEKINILGWVRINRSKLRAKNKSRLSRDNLIRNMSGGSRMRPLRAKMVKSLPLWWRRVSHTFLSFLAKPRNWRPKSKSTFPSEKHSFSSTKSKKTSFSNKSSRPSKPISTQKNTQICWPPSKPSSSAPPDFTKTNFSPIWRKWLKRKKAQPSRSSIVKLCSPTAPAGSNIVWMKLCKIHRCRRKLKILRVFLSLSTLINFSKFFEPVMTKFATV